MLCACSVLAGVMVLPSCDKFMEGYNRGKKQRDDQAQALKDIEETKRAYAKAVEEGMTEEGLQLDAKAEAEYDRKMQAAADKMGGKLGKAMKVALDVQAEMEKKVAVIDTESEKFSSMLDWKSLHEKKDYAERKAYFQKYKEMNREFLQYMEDYDKKIETRLDGIGLTGKERVDFMRGVNKGLAKMLGPIRDVRSAEIAGSECSERLVDLLERNQGKWEIDPDSGNVLFEGDEQVKAFQAEISKLQEAGEKQVEAQKKIVEAMKQ